jgi:L-cysteine desulfidase
MKDKTFLKTLLMREVIPATGCTEAGAVALATAWAVRALCSRAGSIEKISVEVDENTYKNGLGVGVPGTGEAGLDFAAAMGALFSGRAEKGLQILENPDRDSIGAAKTLIAEGRVHVLPLPEIRDLFIRAKVHKGSDEAAAMIQGSHDHLVGVEINGEPFKEAPVSEEDLWKRVKEIRDLEYGLFVEFVKDLDVRELPILKQAMEMNMRFANEARKMAPSLRIGLVMEKLGSGGENRRELSEKVQFVTALAVEARMKGLDLPVMACAGSGNQGLVATIPVVEMARRMDSSEDQLLRALALSYLTTIYIKTYTGLLSPICGCGVAAAVGAGCGIVFLMGGDTSQIEIQINNMIGAMAGIICDGAKSGCSLKALMAVGLAVDSTYLSMENVQIPARDGILGKDVKDTLRNLHKIIEGGMASMDATIVKIMEAKR